MLVITVLEPIIPIVRLTSSIRLRSVILRAATAVRKRTSAVYILRTFSFVAVKHSGPH
jgi:hypothetical protein